MATEKDKIKENQILNEEITKEKSEILFTNTISLPVPTVGQQGSVWCGPACAEAILRYFGLNEQRLIENNEPLELNYPYPIQRLLARNMGTNTVPSVDTSLSGTHPLSVINVLNTFIRTYTLNSRRIYEYITLPQRYTDVRNFYNYITRSLENNSPAILGFNGSLPNGNQCTTQISHFIIIRGRTAVQDDNYNNVAYYYMDPGVGTTGIFFGQDLYNHLTTGNGPSALIRASEELMDWNTSVSQNIEDGIEDITSRIAHCNLISFSSKFLANESQKAATKVDCTSNQELYFNEDKSVEIFTTTYSGGREKSKWMIYEWNLGKYNPLFFSKIEVIYDNDDQIYTKTSLGNDNKYGTKLTDFFKDHPIKKTIKNGKITNDNAANYGGYTLADWYPANLTSSHIISLSFYWEENNYYLQLMIYHHAWNKTSFLPQGGGLWTALGKGIKLI